MKKKLERIGTDGGSFLYDCPFAGFSLRFVSGPEMTNETKKGAWLDTWEIVEGKKRRVGFGPRKNVVFGTKEAAIAAQAELEKDADIITEVAE